MNKNVAPKISGRRWAIAIVVRLAVGIVWDVLAAAILFHSYSFFESIGVCLLVMILCAAATARAESDRVTLVLLSVLPGMFQRPEDAKDSDTAKLSEPDVLDQVQGVMKVLFYGIAFAMALVKLVMTLIG